MVIDTSAILAILLGEPEGVSFTEAIAGDSTRLMSTASVLEASMVIEGRKSMEALPRLDAYLHRSRIRIVPFDVEQLSAARGAFREFGKGRHRASLNFGDCMSYALAKVEGEPLLFKGTDFGSTDVRPVLS